MSENDYYEDAAFLHAFGYTAAGLREMVEKYGEKPTKRSLAIIKWLESMESEE